MLVSRCLETKGSGRSGKDARRRQAGLEMLYAAGLDRDFLTVPHQSDERRAPPSPATATTFATSDVSVYTTGLGNGPCAETVNCCALQGGPAPWPLVRYTPARPHVRNSSAGSRKHDESGPDRRRRRRRLLRLLFRMNGHDTRCAANGAEALDAVRAESPKVLVLDVMMPELDGLAVLRALRASGLLDG